MFKCVHTIPLISLKTKTKNTRRPFQKLCWVDKTTIIFAKNNPNNTRKTFILKHTKNGYTCIFG